MAEKRSKRTKDVIKLSRLFFFLSFACVLGTALFTVITVFSKIGGSEKTGVDILSDTLKNALISVSITCVIGAILFLLIRDKIRTTLYMLALIVNAIIFKEVGMYVVLGVYALDEYIFTALYKHYKQLATINKEIDRR